MEGANPFVATFETGRHYKVHRSYVWAGPAVAIGAVIVVGALNSIQAIVELAAAARAGALPFNPLFAVLVGLVGLAVLFGIMVGLYELAWRNMSYVFDEREFSYYSGIITKRRVHVPYARVQSVNHRASILQRIVGVCTVTIDSAGGSSNRGVRVPFLRLETSERMRAELFMRKAAVEAGMEAAIVYYPQADTGTHEGVQAERAQIAQRRSAAPVAPGRVVASAPVSWICPQCGNRNQGNFCGSCGAKAPEAMPAATQPAPQQPNALDQVAGVVGDWRGLYGGASTFGEQSVSYEYGLSNRELLLTAVSHDTPLAVALIVGLSFAVMLAFMLLIQDEVALFLSAIGLPVVVGSAIVTWVFGLITVLLSYGNFRARRRGSRIEIERGLLARESSGIDIQRVQSIEIRQSFIRRCIGYCEVSLGRIDTANEQNSSNNNSKMNAKGLVIHPFVKLNKVDEILDGLAPEFAGRPRVENCTPLPKQAMRRALLRRCIWYNWALYVVIGVVVCWAIAAVAVNAGDVTFASMTARAQYDRFMIVVLALVVVICAGITVARGFGAVLWARHSGYAWNQRYVLLANDGLSTSQSIVPRQKIQAAATRSNPFQRRLSLVTLQVVTAAGTNSTTSRLLDVPAEAGAAYLDWVKPRR